MGMSTFPRYTVIACTDRGDFPQYAHDADWAGELVTQAARYNGVGCVIVEEDQVEVGRAKTDDPEDLAELLALVADDVETLEVAA